MAAVGTVQVRCPECGVAVPMALEVRSTGFAGDAVVVEVEADPAEVIFHSWVHDQV